MIDPLESSPPLAELPPSPAGSGPSSDPDPSPSPNRAAIAADLALIAAWIPTSGRLKLVDLGVTRLTGRSLTQRFSAVSSMVMNLTDDELELVATGLLERAAGYLGLAPPAGPPTADELAIVNRIVESGLVRK